MNALGASRVHIAKEFYYNAYLGFAGLELAFKEHGGKKKYTIQRKTNINERQLTILRSWLGEVK